MEDLQSKVFCEQHNNALTALDEEAALLFATLRQIIDPTKNVVPANPKRRKAGKVRFLPFTTEFRGHLIERWLLKALCGTLAGGLLRQEKEVPRGWTPPLKWLKILYGFEPWPPAWGLHLLIPPEGSFEVRPGALELILRRDPEEDIVYGCEVTFVKLLFLLATHDITANALRGLEDFGAVRRPAGVNITYEGKTTALTCDWGNDAASPRLSIRSKPKQ